jgi:hypothetical protein
VDYRISFDAREAAIRKGPHPSVANGADPGDFSRALVDRTALTLRDDAEAIGARQAGVCECALPVAALAAHRAIVHCARLRSARRRWLLNDDGACRNNADNQQ